MDQEGAIPLQQGPGMADGSPGFPEQVRFVRNPDPHAELRIGEIFPDLTGEMMDVDDDVVIAV